MFAVGREQNLELDTESLLLPLQHILFVCCVHTSPTVPLTCKASLGRQSGRMWDLMLYFSALFSPSHHVFLAPPCPPPALGMMTAQSEACSTPGRATRAASPQKGCSCPGLYSRWPWAPGMVSCWWKVALVILCFCVLGMGAGCSLRKCYQRIDLDGWN